MVLVCFLCVLVVLVACLRSCLRFISTISLRCPRRWRRAAFWRSGAFFKYLHFEWDRWIGKTCPCYRSWLGSEWEEGALFSAQPLRALHSVESVLPWLLPSLRAKRKALAVQRAGIDAQSGERTSLQLTSRQSASQLNFKASFNRGLGSRWSGA